MDRPRDPAAGSLAGPIAALQAESLDRVASWWDARRGLCWNPPGSLDEFTPARTVHLVPQSSWFALGLLQRDGPGDRSRASRILEELVALQYDRPGTPWHGSFARFAETPDPEPGAVMWEDYDPNWRQFLGTAFGLVLEHRDQLPAALAVRLEDAVDLAVRGEPEDRVPPWYTNIALKRAFLEVEHGRRTGDAALAARGEVYAREVIDRFDRYGAFDEFNSPTYYGVDLYALALWRSRATSELLRAQGARLESALWRTVGRWYHAGLRNLAAPYTRAYGMDLTAHVGKLGLWIAAALGRERAPLPPASGTAQHEHDWAFPPCIAALGVTVPDDVVEHLTRFTGERLVEQELPGGRHARAWLGDEVMLGLESGGGDWGGWDQFVAGAVHWRRGEGGAGWLRVEPAGALSGRAEPGLLVAQVGAPRAPGARTRLVVAGAHPDQLSGGRWSLPGAVVEVTTDGRLGRPEIGAGIAAVPVLPRVTGEGVELRIRVRAER